MSLTKSEAIYSLAFQMGIADGDFSKDEVARLERNPNYIIINEDFDRVKYEEKNNLGETTKENAIQTLKSLDLNSQIEALAIVWHILIADGLMRTEEKVLMVNLLEEFNCDINTISNKLQEMLS
tara:strand:+ start:269 stop:640 length:372 start_codon:yes stop_codon:yes gene_type:complete